MRRARGFTLLELVLVLLLVALVAALAASSLNNFLKGRRSANAAAQVLALAQYARTQAVGKGETYRLNVDSSAGTCWLTVQRGVEFGTLANEFGRTFTLPEELRAEWSQNVGGETWFEFLPDGRVAAPVLTLTDRSGRVVELGCRSETEPLIVLNGEAGR